MYEKLNDLAADGWEYVGPLGNSMIAFKCSRATLQQIAAKKELAKWEGSWESDGDVKLTIKGDRFTSSCTWDWPSQREDHRYRAPRQGRLG